MLSHPWFTRPQPPLDEVPAMYLTTDQENNVIDLTPDVQPLGRPNHTTTSQPLQISTSKAQVASSPERPLSTSVASDATFHSARSNSESHSEADDPATPADENSGRFDEARTA